MDKPIYRHPFLSIRLLLCFIYMMIGVVYASFIFELMENIALRPFLIIILIGIIYLTLKAINNIFLRYYLISDGIKIKSLVLQKKLLFSQIEEVSKEYQLRSYPPKMINYFFRAKGSRFKYYFELKTSQEREAFILKLLSLSNAKQYDYTDVIEGLYFEKRPWVEF